MATTRRLTILTVGLSLSVSPAFAGPVWEENSKSTEAGPVPATAQTVSTVTGGSVTRIIGATTGAALVGVTDIVDMYLVKTGSTSASLYAFDITLSQLGGSSLLPPNSRLYLFKKVVESCAGSPLEPHAIPVACSTTFSSGLPFPRFYGNATFTNATTTKLGDLLAVNTEYYVAVTAPTVLPLLGKVSSCQTPSFTGFANATGLGMYGAFDPSDRFHDWTTTGTPPSGQYVAELASVLAVPASDCSAALPVQVASVACSFSAAPLLPLSRTCGTSTATYKKAYLFEWVAPCSGLAQIGTCATVVGNNLLMKAYEVCPCGSQGVCDGYETGELDCSTSCSSYPNDAEVSFVCKEDWVYLIVVYAIEAEGTATVSFNCQPYNATCDINGDGIVNGADLSIFLSRWGTGG